MSSFNYQNGVLHAEEVPLPDIAAAHGTPCYVYSTAEFENNWRALDSAFGDTPHLICYAVKANSNLAILNLLAKLGSGFDIVSGGELQRVLAAGGDADKIVFSGVAKSSQEIEMALSCSERGVRCINIESRAELDRIQHIAAKLNTTARIGFRVNPDVDARTHPYIATGLETAKFGLAFKDAIEAYEAASAMPNISIHSMACHIGSQITELEPFADAVSRVALLVLELAERGIEIQQLDLGGGLGIAYQGETPPSAQAYVDNLLAQLKTHGVNIPIAIEPGRYIAGNAGVLLTRVEYLKPTASKNFAIVDAGMNDLMRPSLYQAYHQIRSVTEPTQSTASSTTPSTRTWEVVGPVCESADVLGSDRELSLNDGDLLSIDSAGAYSFVMASNYNTRPKPPEVLVDGNKVHLVRQRERFADLIAGESIPD